MALPTDNRYLFFTDKIRAKAMQYGIPVEIGVWQLWQESRYKTDVVSSAGAIGIAQFIPAAAQDYKVDPYDVDSSIDGWGRYMQSLYKRFGRWDHALAGYNAGPGNVIKYKGVPPFKETQHYVEYILTQSGYNPTTGKKSNNIKPLLIVSGISIALLTWFKFKKKKKYARL
ncbi:lytic transglycosylase domain-containing protein [Dokdonia sp.]|uniref:lytic transglycosylase domain-containing protein n=1 Tax=Dokdonia sp. TaxID=2024995 RepID=UPI003263AF42